MINLFKKMYSKRKFVFKKIKKFCYISVGRFTIFQIANELVDRFSKSRYFDEHFVDVTLPVSVNLSSGGTVSIRHPKCDLLYIPGGTVFARSDVIIANAKAIFTKVGRPQESKEIFVDDNLLFHNRNEVALSPSKNQLSVDSAFSLLGVSSIHWAHFLFEFLPKLEFCRDVLVDCKNILVDETNDLHIIQILEMILPESVKIIFVPQNSSVMCDHLYYCQPVSYFCNHSSYIACHDIVIPEPTQVALKSCIQRIKQNLNINIDDNSPKKLYLSYSGERSCPNELEIRSFFMSHGYSVIEPHRLSLFEKVSIFSGAELVVGIASSGFSNVIFTDGYVRCLSLINFERSMDAGTSQITTVFDNIEITLFSGRTIGKPSINSQFDISVHDVVTFCKKHKFV